MGEDICVSNLARAAGVSHSAVMRCLHRAVYLRGKVDLNALAWPELKVHVNRLFLGLIANTPVPALVQTTSISAGAASVAGYIASEVQANSNPLLAASLAAGFMEHQRPTTPEGVASLLYDASSAAHIPVSKVRRSLLEIIEISRVFPTYITIDMFMDLVSASAGFLACLEDTSSSPDPPTGEGPPLYLGT